MNRTVIQLNHNITALYSRIIRRRILHALMHIKPQRQSMLLHFKRHFLRPEAQIRKCNSIAQILDFRKIIRNRRHAAIAIRRFSQFRILTRCGPAYQLSLRIEQKCFRILHDRDAGHGHLHGAIHRNRIIAYIGYKSFGCGIHGSGRCTNGDQKISPLQHTAVSDCDGRNRTVFLFQIHGGHGNDSNPVGFVYTLDLRGITAVPMHRNTQIVFRISHLCRGKNQNFIRRMGNDHARIRRTGINFLSQKIRRFTTGANLYHGFLCIRGNVLQILVQLLIVLDGIFMICQLLLHDILHGIFHHTPDCFRFRHSRLCLRRSLRNGLRRFLCCCFRLRDKHDFLRFLFMQISRNNRFRGSKRSRTDNTKHKCGYSYAGIMANRLFPVIPPPHNIFFYKVFFCHTEYYTDILITSL